MFEWAGRWYRRRQRKVDLAVLWPFCVEKTPTLLLAREIFEVHALSDKAWTKDMSRQEIHIFCQGLERP